MLPFPCGENLPSEAQQALCEQSRIVHVAALALPNFGPEHYHEPCRNFNIFNMHLPYLSWSMHLPSPAGNIGNWRSTVPRSKVFQRSSKVLCVGSQPPDAVDRLRSCHFASEQGASHAMLTQFQQLLLRQST